MWEDVFSCLIDNAFLIKGRGFNFFEGDGTPSLKSMTASTFNQSAKFEKLFNRQKKRKKNAQNEK